MTQAATISPTLAGGHTCEDRKCRHCGNSFRPRFEEEHFCCTGCRTVHDLIFSEGLGSFYDLLSGRLLEPVRDESTGDDTIHQIEEAALEEEESARLKGGAASLTLRIGNLSCTACVWLIDLLFQKQPGALKSVSDPSRSTLRIQWTPGEFSPGEFARVLQSYGYPASLFSEEDAPPPSESSSLLTRMGVVAGLALNTMAFTLPSYLGLETGQELSRLFTLVAVASSTLALAVGGSYFFQRAWTALRNGMLHMDFPISLGLIVAYLGSLGGWIAGIDGMLYFDFVATFVLLMLAGRWLHLRLLERNRNQLWARERDLTSVRRVTPDGVAHRIRPREINAEDHLEIPDGAITPVESTLDSETGEFRLDWINGEPGRVTFCKGQTLRAGSRNGSGKAIAVLAAEDFHGSLLERLLAEAADPDDSERTRLIQRVLRIWLSVVVGTAVAGGIAWVAAGAGLGASLQVALSVLVVSCPCAIGLALPLLDEMLLSSLKRRGVFIRRHSLWSRISSIKSIAFDKTGTLTEPARQLTNPEALEQLTPQDLSILRQLTRQNPHPVARALSDSIIGRFGPGKKELTLPFQDVPGKGVAFRADGNEWRLGRPDWAGEDCDSTNSTATRFSKNGSMLGEFHIAETLRDGAASQVGQLLNRGYDIQILSGDPDRKRVEKSAKLLGIESRNVHANLTPEEKAEYISVAGGKNTLFMGDGGNDSLAFLAAGASGTPATGIRAVEGKADFVFTGRGFRDITQLLDTAKRRRKLLAGIFSAAIIYNIVAIGICLAGWMSPLLAAVAMPVSSIVTTAIASRGGRTV